jgi:CheY-like chemotaxis protein
LSAVILIVDDNEGVRELLSRLLTKKGYEVFSACGPWEALEIVSTIPVIDVVISDVQMPEMNGPQLIHDIHELSPETRTVLMSADMGEVALPSDVPFLRKPFDWPVLFSVLSKLAPTILPAIVGGRCTERERLVQRYNRAAKQLVALTTELAAAVESFERDFFDSQMRRCEKAGRRCRLWRLRLAAHTGRHRCL